MTAAEIEMAKRLSPSEQRVAVVPRLVATPQGLIATYRQMKLHSVYQPIVSVVHNRVIGFEALLRVTGADGATVPLPLLFKEAEVAGDSEALNHLVCELHLAGYASLNPGDLWLFINLDTSAFEAMLESPDNLLALTERYAVAPYCVVIEVLEKQIVNDESFSRYLKRFKEAGFLVAIDDFGEGHSNFDRVFNLSPAIVKFDMSIISIGRSHPKFQLVCQKLTEMLHAVEAMVIAEGIESPEDAAFMIDAGVDFLQGYWIAPPTLTITADDVNNSISELRKMYIEKICLADRAEFRERELLKKAMLRAIEHFAFRGDIKTAAADFFSVAGTRRFYILDETGHDLGVFSREDTTSDPLLQLRLRPLRPGRDSNMSHRHYFRQALMWPQQFFFSTGVFSFLDGISVTIVSKAAMRNGQPFVACGVYTPAEGDIIHDNLASSHQSINHE